MIPNFHLKQQKGELTLPQTSQRKNVAGQKDLGWRKRKVEIKKSVWRTNIVPTLSLRASSLIWASEATCATTRERAPQPRGAQWPSSPLPPALASPLACLSRVYFSRYPPNGELARRVVSNLWWNSWTIRVLWLEQQMEIGPTLHDLRTDRNIILSATH